VVDDTALLALGSGSQLMSRLVVAAHGESDRYVYAPAMCVAAAVSGRPVLADHVGGLLAINVVDLDFVAASIVGRLIDHGADWRRAHAIATARPTAEWPTGLPVVTGAPGAYAGHSLRTIALS
jgi:hypothetical protein